MHLIGVFLTRLFGVIELVGGLFLEYHDQWLPI